MQWRTPWEGRKLACPRWGFIGGTYLAGVHDVHIKSDQLISDSMLFT
jgi:hypothetical protein